MKNAKKMIVAAGFVSLLFAPLAQAQTPSVEASGGGNILFEVVGSSVSVEATGINFGTVTPNISVGNAIRIDLSCDDGLVETVTNGVVFEGATHCGEITVKPRGSSTQYKLQVEVGPLTNASDGTIAPTLKVVTDSNGNIAGLNNITSTSTSSAPISIASTDTEGHTYKIGGNMLITPQDSGDYSGEYTVVAIVR